MSCPRDRVSICQDTMRNGRVRSLAHLATEGLDDPFLHAIEDNHLDPPFVRVDFSSRSFALLARVLSVSLAGRRRFAVGEDEERTQFGKRQVEGQELGFFGLLSCCRS